MNKKGYLTVFIIAVIITGLYFMFLPKGEKIEYEDNHIAAVVFIGGLEGYYDYSVVEKYFPENDYPVLELGGREKYLIIPRYKQPVSVYRINPVEDMAKKDLIAETDGNFYIRCNVSDIYSNVLIEMEHNGQKYEFSPFLSGKDGSVIVPDFVKVVLQ